MTHRGPDAEGTYDDSDSTGDLGHRRRHPSQAAGNCLHAAAGGQRVEKWIPRGASEDLLPRQIIWRDKKQVDEGSGTVDIIAPLLDRRLCIADAQAWAGRHPEARQRSREECADRRRSIHSYRGAEAVLNNVTRWSGRPEGPAIEK